MPPKPKTPPPPPELKKRVVLTVINQKGGTTKCLAADTLIPDPVTGVPRTIREVMENPAHDQIVTLRDRTTIVPAPIAAKVDNGVRPTVKVTFASGRSVTCTPNHPFLLPDGWRRADELTVGHTAALPRRLPHPSDPVRLKDAEVTLLAVLLAEGGLTQRQARFSTNDPEVLRRTEAAARDLGWTVSHVHRYDYRINGPRLAGPMAFARRHGMNKLAKDKTMPEAVYQLPADQLADFIGLFWMCDGSVPKDGPRVVLASETLVRALQHLLLRFGIQSTVRQVTARSEAWRLSVPKMSWPAFREHIPLWGEKRERLEAMADQPEFRWLYDVDTDVYWDRITSIKDAGTQQVYDLTVDDTHCFVANDVIVHNTTTAVNLGAAFAEMGLKVRIIDADPQAGSVTHWLPPQQDVGGGLVEVYHTILDRNGEGYNLDEVTSTTTVENLFLVPSWTSMRVVEQERKAGADQVLKYAISQSTAPIDIEIIDAPHTLDVVAIGATAAAQELIIPTQASDLDIVGMGELLSVVDRIKRLMSPDLEIAAIVLGRTKPNAQFDQGLLESFRTDYPDSVIAAIPDTVRMREATTAHQPITVYEPRGKASKAFRAMATELVERWKV